MKKPKTLQEAIIYFAEPDNCLAYMVRCAGRMASNAPLVAAKMSCSSPISASGNARASIIIGNSAAKVGTIFEDSPISLDKWLAAVWMIANCKNGISSYEVRTRISASLRSRHGSCFTAFGWRCRTNPS